MAITYTLLAAQNAQRVRLQTTDSDAISVVVGAGSETWPAGCYIEVLNLGTPGTMTIVPDSGIILNFFNGAVIPANGYARVSQVIPGEWDVHVYFPGLPASGGSIEVTDADGATVAASTTLIQAGPGLLVQLIAPNSVRFSVGHVSEEIGFGV